MLIDAIGQPDAAAPGISESIADIPSRDSEGAVRTEWTPRDLPAQRLHACLPTPRKHAAVPPVVVPAESGPHA